MVWFNRPERPAWLVDGPVPRPPNWLELVNRPQTDVELGLEASLRTRGRPRKEQAEQQKAECPLLAIWSQGTRVVATVPLSD